jgi:hypothetical protein
MVLTSIENRVPAHISDIHMANIVHILVIGCRVDYDVCTPNLELLHLIAEGDGKFPVCCVLSQPGLIQVQLANIALAPGVSFVDEDT